VVGLVICAHGNLAEELLSTLLFITGGDGVVSAVAMDHNVDATKARELVKNAIMDADDGDGVLVTTDIFGGSPSNICLSLQGEFKMEVLAGVNMPILLKAVSMQKSSDLNSMAVALKKYGRENIHLASELLKKKDDKKQS